MKFLFVAMGPGETGHARALAKYIAKQGGKILFALHQEINIHFLADDKEFKIFLTQGPKELGEIIEKEKPKILLLFNSKIWGGYKNFLNEPPFLKPPLSFCFDSNWLFNEDKYPFFPFIRWADKYFIVLPKKIFDLGLKKSGGNFEIPKKNLEKIIPIGFVPSYKKPTEKEMISKRKEYGIKSKEKLIFSYFSGFGATHRTWAFENFIRSVEKLVKKGRRIKAIYVGPTKDLPQKKLKKDWLFIKEKLSVKDYFLTLASSDLVFQHQGLVTLAQAISCQIPVIANVSLLRGKNSISRLHFWEVEPFQRAGVCTLFSKSAPVGKISQEIKRLLFDKYAKERMKKKQKSIYVEGEKRTFEIIKKIIYEKA